LNGSAQAQLEVVSDEVCGSMHINICYRWTAIKCWTVLERYIGRL